MSQEKPKVKNPNAMLGLEGLAIFMVLYMYYQLLRDYFSGMEDGPSLTVVIVGGIILVGGSIFVGIRAIRLYRQTKQREKEEKEALEAAQNEESESTEQSK